MSILKSIRNFFGNAFGTKSTRKKEVDQVKRLYKFSNIIVKTSREASNDLLSDGTLMIVKDGEFDKWVKFTCPCGCGEKHAVSLQKNHHPHWSLVEDDGLVSLHPSVHVNGEGGCGAHFFLRKNRIDWVD